MTADSLNPPASVTAAVTLSGPDWQLQTKITVPAGPTQLRQMLPMIQALTDRVVDGTVQALTEQGQAISCKKGCGACCRQLVPIAEMEAYHIRDVVHHLPEPRRLEIRARFAEARRRLEEAGLLEKLQHPEQWSKGDGRSLGIDYFREQIPCPFLEEESCSIYTDRPLACREYLVTSPAENCARPTPETIRPVPMPLKMWTAVARSDEIPASARFIRWVPLILAPEWADTHPDEPPPRPGPALLREFLDHLIGSKKQELPESQTAAGR